MGILLIRRKRVKMKVFKTHSLIVSSYIPPHGRGTLPGRFTT